MKDLDSNCLVLPGIQNTKNKYKQYKKILCKKYHNGDGISQNKSCSA